MPNTLAYIMLGLWPLVMLGLFRFLPIGRALIWSFLLSYLILPPYPTAFDFPLLPPFDKTTLPYIVSLFCVVVVAGQRFEWMPKTGAGKALALVFVFSPILTVLTNAEPILFVTSGIRGLYAMDIVGLVGTQAIMILGFLLARQFLTTEEALRDLLIAFLITGVAYAFPMLLEVRLSPQLNIWIYGFFQHMFDQMIRGDGFRPIVFLSHGIWAAMFAMMSLVSAVILFKFGHRERRFSLMLAVLLLGATLILAKTLSALIYALLLMGLLLFLNPRQHIRMAALLAILALAYPLAKTADVVPEERILTAAATISEERARSLEFRLDQERTLLERAMEKPLFGWGSWGRNQIHDPFSGEMISVSDGRWIITLGIFGLFGYLAEFGLLALPIFLLFRFSFSTEISPFAAGLSLLLAVNMVDLLPNATLTPLTWLIAGALLGYAEANFVQRKKPLDTTPKLEDVKPNRPRTIL